MFAVFQFIAGMIVMFLCIVSMSWWAAGRSLRRHDAKKFIIEIVHAYWLDPDDASATPGRRHVYFYRVREKDIPTPACLVSDVFYSRSACNDEAYKLINEWRIPVTHKEIEINADLYPDFKESHVDLYA